jgi:hypothetical protein
MVDLTMGTSIQARRYWEMDHGWMAGRFVEDGLGGDGVFMLRKERVEIRMLWFWYICIEATYILGLTSWSYRCAG